MILRMGRQACSLLLKLLFGIVIVPTLFGLLFFLLCGLFPPLIFFFSLTVFILWGSQWTFAAWFFAGAVVWCGVAFYVVRQKMKQQQSLSTMMSFLYGSGWFLALAGVLLFLSFRRADWSINTAIVCEAGGLVCWYLAERSEKKHNARRQLLAVLHRHTQAELQQVENAGGTRG